MMMTVNINLQLARDFRGEVAFDFLFIGAWVCAEQNAVVD